MLSGIQQLKFQGKSWNASPSQAAKSSCRDAGLGPRVAGTAELSKALGWGTQWAHQLMVGMVCVGSSPQTRRAAFLLLTGAFLNHSPDRVKGMGTCAGALTDCFWYIWKCAFVMEKCLVYIINSSPLMKHFLKISSCTDMLLKALSFPHFNYFVLRSFACRNYIWAVDYNVTKLKICGS